MSAEEKPTVAFILSLIAGIFILLGGGMMSMFAPYGFGGMMNGYSGYGGYGGNAWYGGMMSRYSFGPGLGMMGGLGYGFGFFGILGLIFGLIVIISAIMLNNKPEQHSTWGTLIIVFSVLSIFGSAMGGFGVGLILGLIGGILGVTWKPPQSKA